MEEQMPRATRAVSRKDFLRLSGPGLAGAALLGTTGCGGGQGSGEVIKYLTETPETTNLERTAIEIQVDTRYEGGHHPSHLCSDKED